MNYNFDEIIDRTGTNSENVEGWTLTECVRVLRAAGAADVVCLTLARTKEEH